MSVIDRYRNYARFNAVLLTSDTDLKPAENYAALQQQLAADSQLHEAKTYLIRPTGFSIPGTWSVDTTDSAAFEGSTLAGIKDYTKAGSGVDACATLQDVPAGVYKVWIHCKNFSLPPARDTSWKFHAAVNHQQLAASFGGGGKNVAGTSAYVWMDGGTVTLQEGDNTVSLIDAYCDYAKCDAVLITSDLNIDPSEKTYEELRTLATVLEGQVDSMDDFLITDAYSGGNITVVGKSGNKVSLDNKVDPEEGSSPYFYWNFQVTSDKARTVTFCFDQNKNYTTDLIGNNKILYSTDNGDTWNYMASNDAKSFTYSFQAGQTVRFCNVLPYVLSDWQKFAQKYSGAEYADIVEFSTIGTSAEGRAIPLVIIGNQQAEQCVVFTSRHHCCETIGSYVLEGMLAYMIEEAGSDFLDKYCVYAVPMVDIDGVENGEQGKNRGGAGADHNRDYITKKYPEIQAITSYFEDKNVRAFIDSHAPGSVTTGLGNHLSFGSTQGINPNGTADLEAVMEPRVLNFSSLLDEIENMDSSSDKLTYDPAHRWQAYGNLGQSRIWFQQHGAQLATTIETSFTATPSDHTSSNTNRWGRQIGLAVCSYRYHQSTVYRRLWDISRERAS